MADEEKADGSPVVISEGTGEKISDASAELGEARKQLAVLKSTKKGTDGDDPAVEDKGKGMGTPPVTASAAPLDGKGDDMKVDDADSDMDDKGADKSKAVPADAAASSADADADAAASSAVKPAAKPDNADARSDMMYQNDPGNRITDNILKAHAEQRRLRRQAEEEKDQTEFAEAMEINSEYQKKISDSTHLSDPDKSTDFQVTITYDQNTKEDKRVAILFKNFEIIKVTLPKIARPPLGLDRTTSLASTHIQPITYTLMNCLLECYKVIEKKVTFNSVGFDFRKIKSSQLTDDEKQKIVDILSSLNSKTTNPYAYYLSNIAVYRHAEDKKFFTEIKESDFSKKIELDYLIQFLFYFKFKINAFAGVEYPVQKSFFGADNDTTLIDALQKLRIFPDNSPLYPTKEKRLKRASLANSRARGIYVDIGDGDADTDDDAAKGGKPQTRKSKLRRRKTERRNSKRGKKINA